MAVKHDQQGPAGVWLHAEVAGRPNMRFACSTTLICAVTGLCIEHRTNESCEEGRFLYLDASEEHLIQKRRALCLLTFPQHSSDNSRR